MFRNRFLLSVLFLFPIVTISAECPDYLKGLSNSDIIRFGGLAPRSQVQQMANLMLEYVPMNDPRQIQIAMPVALLVNESQEEQFGDGQKNALAHFGSQQKPPFVAVLSRPRDEGDPAELALILSRELVDTLKISELEIDFLGKRLLLTLDEHGLVRLEVDINKMGWNSLNGAQNFYFRPHGWTDWFSVSFPQTYTSIEQLVGGMETTQRNLPGKESVIDPLGISHARDEQGALRKSESADSLGFALVRVQRSQRVHGIFISSDGTQSPTSTGGIWTRYRLGDPFKIIYLVKDSRAVDIEEEEGVVSGTGPHRIGATGEIILNSLGDEPLMTFFGFSAPSAGPNREKLAWGHELTHQWIGTWLKPDHAFVSPQGSFHWHLNHLTAPVAAQVFTPPFIPSDQNGFGFKH